MFSPESFKDDTAVVLKSTQLQVVALQTVVREDVRPAVGHDGTGDWRAVRFPVGRPHAVVAAVFGAGSAVVQSAENGLEADQIRAEGRVRL